MKKVWYSLLLIIIASSMFVSCNNETPKTPHENPATDFEYNEKNNVIYIIKYIGSTPNVVIPKEIDGKAVCTILQNAFYQNSIIESVVIPDTVTEIRIGAFQECKLLSSVVLPKNLTKIEPYTFAECIKLSSINLPENLTKLGSSCFLGCKSLKYIKIPKSVDEWEGNTFLDSGIETIDIEEGVEMIGNGAFSITRIKQITLPKSIKTIGVSAFCNCYDLESVVLNEGLVTIGRGAFSGKSKLTEIVIPKTVENVWDHSFDKCPTLKKIKFEGNAPKEFVIESLPKANVGFTIYYHEGANGFTTPKWCGYSTELW